jgi:hypothetical protein
MTTSFIEFRGNGFWVHDPEIELFLALLCRQTIETGSTPQWLLAARDDWLFQSTAGLHGLVSPNLDRHIGEDQARLAVVQELCGRTRMALLAFYPKIPKSQIAGFALGSGFMFLDDTSVTSFMPASEAFDQLLAGRLTWDVRTSPVL